MDLFRSPSWLLWLLAWAAGFALLAIYAAARRASLIAAFGLPGTLARLAPSETEGRRWWKTLLQGTAGVLLLLALAGPQWGIELVTSEASGIQVLVAVDTSLSMLAEDVQPSRIEKAKSELALLFDGLQSQRVGVIAFAGKAQLVCPLTTDNDAAKSMLERVSVGMIPQPGTAIGDALDLAAKLLGRYPGKKAVVLITDGEDRRGDPLSAVKAASDAGIKLYIIGVGTPEGGPIPMRDAGGSLTGYLKDRKGETVVTRLEEAPSVRLAAAAQGAYYRATPQENEATAILKQIAGMDRSRIQAGSANVFKNRFRIPLFFAFLALLVEMLIAERDSSTSLGATGAPDRRRRAPALAGRAGALASLVMSLLVSGCDLPGAVDLFRGNRSYAKGDYEQAAGRYQGAAQRMPGDARPGFNTGAAEYKRGRFDEASDLFADLAQSEKTPRRIRPGSWYNLGNTRYRKEDYAGAAEAFRQCLLLDPKDEDCRFNLVQSLKAKKNPPPKQDKKKQDQKDKDKDKDKQQPPSPKPRPRSGGMSQEDADRIMQAVQEKEQSTAKQQKVQKLGVKNQPEEQDW